MLIGRAGSGKTSCIGIMIDSFVDSCWQFATHNAAQAAEPYIRHTSRYYNTTFQFLAVDVRFIDEIYKHMEACDYTYDVFNNFYDFNQLVEFTRTYFISIARVIYQKCCDRRNYIRPDYVKNLIKRLKSKKIEITRENIILYLESYCLLNGKSYNCIPPEIRFKTFGYDEAGRIPMLFFLLDYWVFVYVNELYGMPPCKPTYIFVGSHTQGNVIWRGENDFLDEEKIDYNNVCVELF